MHQTQHCITEASNFIKKEKKGQKTNCSSTHIGKK